MAEIATVPLFVKAVRVYNIVNPVNDQRAHERHQRGFGMIFIEKLNCWQRTRDSTYRGKIMGMANVWRFSDMPHERV